MPGGTGQVISQDSETLGGGRKLLEDCLVRWYWSQLVLLVEVIVRREEEKVERGEEEEEV